MRLILQVVAGALILLLAGVPAMAVVYAQCATPAMPCCAMHPQGDVAQGAVAPCCAVSANPAPAVQRQAPAGTLALVPLASTDAIPVLAIAVRVSPVERPPALSPPRALLCTFLI